jgi:hypothetical protein
VRNSKVWVFEICLGLADAIEDCCGMGVLRYGP